MTDVVLFGTGQISEVVKAYLDWEGSNKVVAYTLSKNYMNEDSKGGIPIIAWEDINNLYPPEQVSLFCPLSYKAVNKYRKNIFDQGIKKGYDFISFIHPNTHYYGTPVGKNCLILESNVIQPHTSIGDNCILWSGNHIGHHTHIGNHVFIASHVVISGSVKIADSCFLGVNSTIRDNIKIGEDSVIGAGALITKNISKQSVIPGLKSIISKSKSNTLDSI